MLIKKNSHVIWCYKLFYKQVPVTSSDVNTEVAILLLVNIHTHWRMGGITSRDAGEEEIDTASTNAYRYPPKIGKKWKIYCKFRCILRKARLKQLIQISSWFMLHVYLEIR